jgi:hypothetical protein
LHGFGVKKKGLARYGTVLASADSMAWSSAARHDPPLPGCTHESCQNCARYAMRWRQDLLASTERDPRAKAAAPRAAPPSTTREEGGHVEDDDSSASTEEPPPKNEEIVIDLALAILQGKGWIEEPDDELIETLGRLYRENAVCQIDVTFTGETLHDALAGRPGEYLFAAFEQECQDHWEREAERWSCPCGLTFGLYPFSERNVHFFTLADDGLFNQAVIACPRCTRNLLKTREQHADGQLGFAF